MKTQGLASCVLRGAMVNSDLGMVVSENKQRLIQTLCSRTLMETALKNTQKPQWKPTKSLLQNWQPGNPGPKDPSHLRFHVVRASYGV